MAKKKKVSEKELKAKLKKARAGRASAEKSAEKWKARAEAHRTEAAALEAELSAVRRRLAKAEAPAAPRKDTDRSPRPRSAPRAGSAAAAPQRPTRRTGRPVAPDDSWTVSRLRVEARTRGVAGYSRKTKAQLLAALRG